MTTHVRCSSRHHVAIVMQSYASKLKWVMRLLCAAALASIMQSGCSRLACLEAEAR